MANKLYAMEQLTEEVAKDVAASPQEWMQMCIRDRYVSLKVSWIEQATIEIVKKDDTADVNLVGAVFGVYSDCLLYTSRCV